MINDFILMQQVYLVCDSVLFASINCGQTSPNFEFVAKVTEIDVRMISNPLNFKTISNFFCFSECTDFRSMFSLLRLTLSLFPLLPVKIFIDAVINPVVANAIFQDIECSEINDDLLCFFVTQVGNS